MIEDCINDIKVARKESPSKLFARLVNDRLQLALKSYYSDLTNKFGIFESQSEKNASKVMKKLIK